MNFNNRPNQCISINKSDDSTQLIWVSRSVAVLAIPFFVCNSKIWVPLGKRSTTCPTEAGKWGLPAGYLDWDESADEAMIREVWEELGLNLRDYNKICSGSIDQPYYVFSDPNGDASQNVTLRFTAVFEVENLPQLTRSTEVEEAKWFLTEEAMNMNLAFNHADILKELCV